MDGQSNISSDPLHRPISVSENSSDRLVSPKMNHPGAAPYGNFINYYTFNPPENRLSLIPHSILQDLEYTPSQTLVILDVGCNSGELTFAFYKHLHKGCFVDQGDEGKHHLLGIDLDETLIHRAQNSNPFPGQITFTTLDITQDKVRPSQLDVYLKRFGRTTFHLTICLAVTMWIHLNHGDDGFLGLLSHLATVSDHLLLEVQPWKCYRSAARRLRKLGHSNFEHFKSLEIRGDMEENACQHLERNCMMELMKCYGKTGWDRKLLLFRRRSTE